MMFAGLGSILATDPWAEPQDSYEILEHEPREQLPPRLLWRDDP
jgi:hypothetical protein